MAVLILQLTTDHRNVGTVVLALALIPSGDMSDVLASSGSKAAALSVHGLTCLLMLFAGLLLFTRFAWVRTYGTGVRRSSRRIYAPV